MPTLIAAAVLPFVVNSPVFFLGPAAVSAVASGIGYAAVAGATLLAQAALTPRVAPTKPEDVQGNYRQATPTRIALYGQGKLGGPYLFRETNDDDLFQVIALASRKLSSIEEFWLDDEIVTLDANGDVTTGGRAGDVVIQHRLGLDTETAYATLINKFDQWTADHRGDGIASLFTRMESVDPEEQAKIFPNGANTLFRVVARGCVAHDPRDLAEDAADAATWGWQDNLALVTLDYMRHADGMRAPSAALLTPQAIAGWRQAAADCDDLIPLKAGGTERRYRAWGTYSYSERPSDVLQRLMAAGNARFKPTPDGGIHLEAGKWRAPTVTLTGEAITGFQGLGRGRSILETANLVTAQYTSPEHDYQSTDADPWENAADISARGEIPASASFICSPSHAQTRRLMKIEAARLAPEWVGTLVCNNRGCAAYGERFISLDWAEYGIAGDFEVTDFEFLFGEHSTVIGARLVIQSLDETAFAWVAATEEGTAPAVDQTADTSLVPLVTGLIAVVGRKVVSGVLVPYARLSWDPKPRASLVTELRGKRTADAAWQNIPLNQNETTADSFVLSDGEEYEFQARYRRGGWSVSAEVIAVADPVPPGALTNVDGTGGAGMALIEWTSPNSSNFYAVNIRRAVVNNEMSATLVHTEFGPASNSDSWADTALAAGTYYYFLRSRNGSGVENTTAQGTGPVTVT